MTERGEVTVPSRGPLTRKMDAMCPRRCDHDRNTKWASAPRLLPTVNAEERPHTFGLDCDSRSAKLCMADRVYGVRPNKIPTKEKTEPQDRTGKSTLRRCTLTEQDLLTHGCAVHQTLHSSYSKDKTA